MKKMNNKGFSLVELIVVVLIMAIIAVALAPQVMKWVDNSRRSTDEDNYNEMIANAQVALTDKNAYAAVYATGAAAVKYIIQTDNNGTKLYKDSVAAANDMTATQSTASDAVAKAMYAVSANWSSIKAKVAITTAYQIDIYSDGSVRKTANCPTLNADLS